ncbi:Cna B-type domain-containing protein, partial [Streptococcus entericus]|uniref:Cna B-type domain-containing protein n=1 Tax=Streptococcus entericus TaxID=155680 RepID=UPI00036D4E9A
MRKKIFIPFILIFSLFLSLLTPSVSNVLAQEQGDVITEMTVTDAEGKPITGDISQWQTFRINGKFSLPDNTVKAGDTTTVTLPPEIQFSGQATFELRDEQKELVGTGVVNNNNPREIIITYTKYPETKSGVKGSFYFYVKFDFNVVPTRKEVPIDIKVSGKIMHAGNVTYEGIGQIDKSDIAKSGWQDKDDPKIGHFYIDINRGNKDMSDIKLVDVLKDPNVTYIPDSFRIYRGTLDFRNGDWGMYDEELITDEVLPDRDAVANSNTFTLHFGNLLKDKGIRIFYDVKLGHTPVDSEKFLNDATLTTAEGIEELVHSGYTFYAAGGKAEGYVYKIKIKKVNEQREALEGATFDVIRERTGRSVGTITTDAKGEGTLGDLLNDTYILRETEAPRGYVKAEDVKINPSDFDADTKLATKQIINKQETISIPVTKIWEGDQPTMRPETITVQLLADGEEVSGKTLKLDATSDWKGTFTDLPKMKDGKEIVYTIKEVVVPKGYTSEISGDATTGYTVTNTYRTTPTTATIVAKKTLENRDLLADEFSFKLAKEDGEVIKTVTNDGAGNIKFPELSFDKAGIYNYTITEVKGTDSTITYDETPVKVTVTVKDNGKGQLEAQVS